MGHPVAQIVKLRYHGNTAPLRHPALTGIGGWLFRGRQIFLNHPLGARCFTQQA